MTPHLPGRRTLAVVAAILGLVGCQRDAPLSSNTLRVGMSLERPGFAVRTPQGIAGFDVDVATYVARRLGRDSIDIIETPPAQLAMVLATRQVDLVVTGLPMTEDRAAEMITVAGPY
ncbi:MAG: transporter substrate-binding domain-containing protein, partial [Nostocoides sp.]